MSDFITGLRADLLEAAAREAAATRPVRVRRRVVIAVRPALVAGAVALVALATALAGLLHSVAPEPQPASMKVAQFVHLGGLPSDAVLGAGALWALDYRGALVRVGGPRSEVLKRITVPEAGAALSAAGGRVWLLAPNGRNGYELTSVDARTGGDVVRRQVRAVPVGLAATRTGAWVSEAEPARAKRLDRR